MAVTKPCPRAGQNGCIGTVTARDVGQLAKRQFCSLSCSAFARVARGIKAPKQSHDFYVAQGAKGGTTSGRNRRKAAALSVAADMKALMPKDMALRLSDADYRRVLALLVRACLHGHELGRHAEWMRQRDERTQKGAAA